MQDQDFICEVCEKAIADDEPFYCDDDCYIHNRCWTPERQKREPHLKLVPALTSRPVTEDA